MTGASTKKMTGNRRIADVEWKMTGDNRKRFVF